jgi:hypothetical protein
MQWRVIVSVAAVASLSLAGCARRAAEADGQAPVPEMARLVVPQHTGARAGNEPVHVDFVEVDGVRHDLTHGDHPIQLPPGRHEVAVAYERCFHAPTQLVAPGGSRAVPTVAGRIVFEAEPGGRYVLGCTAGGGGAMITNAHWVERQLPGGKRQRVADGKAGSDFPVELLGTEPPEPMKAPGTPIAPR